MTIMNETPTPGGTQPVPVNLPDAIQPVSKTPHEDTQPVVVLPAMSAGEEIPDWLLDFARTPEPETVQPQSDYTQHISLPSAVFSDQERSVGSRISDDIEPADTIQANETLTHKHVESIWEKEDAVQLGPVGPHLTFVDPMDELKTLLDENPQETAKFIRAHMHDAEFRAEAAQSLRAYLTLDPKNDMLWQVFDELQHPDPNQEA